MSKKIIMSMKCNVNKGVNICEGIYTELSSSDSVQINKQEYVMASIYLWKFGCVVYHQFYAPLLC